jgi:3D (Asp-Asp-Asp) domain-containing protein
MTNLIAIVTAYCACVSCCGKSPGDPGYGITASGKQAQQGVSIAAPRWVPFGSRVYVSGLGWRTVHDRMSRKYPDRWDVYFEDHREALKFGKQKLNLKLYDKNRPTKAAAN